jgi:ribose 1,5-bisphosphokinase PhnN
MTTTEGNPTMPNRTPPLPPEVQVARRTIPPNAPHYSLAAGVLLVVVGIVAAVLTDSRDTLNALLVLIVTTVPSLLAAGYAERASRDIRNGTVTEKARQGTHKALEESGVTEVVAASNKGQASLLAMEALSALLDDARVRATKERDASRHRAAQADLEEDDK